MTKFFVTVFVHFFWLNNLLLNALNPHCKFISSPSLRIKIDDVAIQLMKTLLSHLNRVRYVARTTDCWSAHQKSFIGVTAHWIDEKTLKWRSAALACQRLRGSRTFDVMAGILNDVHCKFKIRGKGVQNKGKSFKENNRLRLKLYKGIYCFWWEKPNSEQESS